MLRKAGCFAVACLAAAPFTSLAAPWRVDFEVQVTGTGSIGDVSVLGDPLAGLSVSDTVTGSFLVEAPQADQSAAGTIGRFAFTDLVLDLPSGPAISLDLTGLTGFEFLDGVSSSDATFDQISGGSFDLFANIIVQQEFFAAGKFQFSESITVSEGTADPAFADVNVLEPVELAEQLVGMSLAYRDERGIGQRDRRNVLFIFTTNVAEFDGVITSASATLVPEPTTGVLLLGGLLAARRRRRV